jgi:1-acyl-sn-glycerol-3-phosphate acyltransferase
LARLIATARGCLRILLAVAFAFLGLPLALGVLLLSFGNSHRRARLGGKGVFLWSWFTRRTLGIRVRTLGTPPPPGSFVIGNHVSHFDILALTSLYPTSLVGKKEILRWPLIGQLAWLIGTVFVDRGDRDKTSAVADRMRGYLQAGATVTLFPEGTCGDGQAVLPFKRSLFAVPAELGIPVWPVAVRYPDPSAAWCDTTPFALHMFRLLCRSHQEAVVVFGDAIPPGLERKPLAFATQEKVERLFSLAGH